MSQRSDIEQIVSMKFDNDQFEKGVSTSIKTIDQLKKSLDFKETEKSLAEFQNSGKNFDVSGIEKGLEALNSRFSVFGEKIHELKTKILDDVIGIGKSVVNLGKEVSKTGWGKYEQETAAVQTMMGNMTDADFALYLLTQEKIKDFEDRELELLDPEAYKKAREAYLVSQIELFDAEDLERDKLEYIEQNLERITWFADETSYSYNDMTSSLAKFLAAGGKIEDSTSAVMGLAVAAADAGVSVENATSLYYNFSQAISAGRMRMVDWISVMNKNMNTPKFMQNLVDTALMLGTIQDNLDGTYTILTDHASQVDDIFSVEKGFSDSLAGNWVTADVMLQTFSRYAEYADMLYETQNKYDLGTVSEAAAKIEELGLEYEKVAKTGFDAAQNTKTFTEAVDFLKDALSTQFKSVYKTVFGGFLEARELWSGLSDIFYENLVQPMEQFNKIMKDWAGKEEGGRDTLLTAFSNAIEAAVRVLNVFRNAISKAFPDFTADKLAELTVRFEKWTESQKMSVRTFMKLSEGLGGILKFLRSIFNLIRDIWNFVKPVFGKILDIIVDVFYHVGKILGKIADFEDAIGGLNGEIEICSILLKRFKNRIKETTGIDLKLPTWSQVIDKLKEFTAKVKELSGVDIHLPTWKEIVDVLVRFKNKIEEITGIDFHMPTWEGFVNVVKDAVHAIERLLNIDIKMPTLDNLAEIVANAIRALTDFKDSIFATQDATEKLTISDRILNGWEKFSGIIDTVKDRITGLFSKKTQDNANETLNAVASDKQGSNWKKFKERLLQIVDAVKGPISKITMGDILNIGMIGSFIRGIWSMGTLVKNAGGVLGALGSLLKQVGKGVKSFLTSLGGGWSAMGKGIQGFFDGLGTSAKAKSWKTRAEAFKNIAIAIAVICGSVILVAKVGKDTDIWGAVGIIGALFAFMLIAALLMDKLDSHGSTGFTVYKSGNKGYFGIAAGIVALLLSFRILKNYTPTEIWNYVGIISAIGGILTLLLGLSKIGGKTGIGQGVAFLLAATALMKMVKIIDKIDSLDLEHKKKTMDILIGIVLGFSLIMRSLKNVKFGGGVAIISAVIAVRMIISALQSLSKIDKIGLKENGGLVAAILAFMLVLGIVSAALSKKNAISITNSKKSIVKIKDSFIGIGIAFLLISLSMKMLSKIEFTSWGAVLLTMAFFLGLVGLVMGIAAKAGPNAKKAGRSVLSVTIALGMLTMVTAVMQYMEWDTLIKGITFFGLLGLVFSAIISAAARYQKGVKSLTGIMICITLMAGLIGGLAYIQHMTGVDFESIFTGMLAMMGGFALVIAAASNFKKGNVWSAVLILTVLGAVVTGISMILSKFNGMLAYDWKSILAYLGGIALLFIAMGVSVRILNGYDKDWKHGLNLLPIIIEFLAGFFAITVTLNYFSSGIDIEKAGVAVGASMLLLAEIAGIAAFLTLTKSSFKNSIGAAINVAVLTGSVMGIMWMLGEYSSKIDPESCLALAHSAAALLLSIGVVAGIATVIGNFAVAAAAGAVIIAGFILLIAGVIGLIGALFPAETIENAVTICTLLGEAIGGFVGGIAAGFKAAQNAQLPGMAENLSEFAEKIQGFGLIAELPEGLTEKAKDLKKAIKQIQDIGDEGIFDGIKDNISGIFSKKDDGGSEDGNIAAVEKYVQSFVGIANSLSEIDDSTYDRIPVISSLIEKLTAAMNGTTLYTDMEWFGSQMTAYSQALVTFASHMTLIPDNLLTKTDIAASVLERMAQASNSIPNGSRTGGKGNFLSWVLGDNDLDSFGLRMSTYAIALRMFADHVKDLPDDLKDKTAIAAGVLEAMANSASNIPNGAQNEKFNLWSFMWGDNDIDYFGQRMVDYAKALKEFSTVMSGVPTRVQSHAKTAANALNAMAEASSDIPNGYSSSFSLFTFFAGGKDAIKVFGENMVSFATDLSAFNTTMQSIDKEELLWSIDTIGNLFGMISTVTLSDSDTIWEFGYALAELADTGIRNFVDAFALAEEDVKEAVENFTGAFVDSLEDPNLRQNMRMTFEGHLTALIVRINERRVDFVTAGKDTVQGFIDGMKSKMDSFTYDNPGEEMAKIVLKGIKGPQALAIASPSKKMHEVGVYTVQGFVDGLHSMFPKIEQATEEAGETAEGGFWGALEGWIDDAGDYFMNLLGITKDGITEMATSVSDALETGFDTEVSIRPVMDLTTLKAQYGSDWTKYGGMYYEGSNLNQTAGVMEKMVGTLTIGDDIRGLRDDFNGFKQAYLNDDGYDPEVIAAAVEKGAMRGTSEGLANTTITMDGKTVTAGVTNRQNSYNRANGGHKVNAVWYK